MNATNFVGLVTVAIAVVFIRRALQRTTPSSAPLIWAWARSRLDPSLTVRLTARRIDRDVAKAAIRHDFRWPSLSQGLVGLAARRLPEAMTDAEKERWRREMRADVASLPGRHRLPVAFNAWRKGAPQMPVGNERAPRSAVK